MASRSRRSSGMTEFGGRGSAIGQVKRLEEGLNVIAFHLAKVVGNARSSWKVIGAAHRVVADLARTSLQAAE